MLQTHADVQVISSKKQRNLTQATRACFRHYEDNKPLFLFLLRLNQKVCWHGFLQDLWVCLWSCPLSSFHCAASTWVGPMASFSSFSMSSSLSLHFLQSLARFVLRRPDAAAGLKNYNYNYLCTIFFFTRISCNLCSTWLLPTEFLWLDNEIRRAKSAQGGLKRLTLCLL